MENAADIQPDYILEQVNQALLQAGYKDSLDDAPWDVIELNGGTNGDYIDEILSYCAAEGFWDAWRLDDVYEENGTWHALLRYGYKALKNTAVYDTGSRRLFVRQTMLADMEGQEKEVYYYVIYNPETYTKRGASFTVGQNTAEGAVYGRPIQIVPVYEQLYETYAPGEYLLDSEGNKVFEYESQPVYSDITSTEYEEVLTELGEVDYDRESGITKVHVDTTGIDWDALDAPVSEIFRAAAPQNYIEVDGRTMAFADYLKEYQGLQSAPTPHGRRLRKVLIQGSRFFTIRANGTSIRMVIPEWRRLPCSSAASSRLLRLQRILLRTAITISIPIKSIGIRLRSFSVDIRMRLPKQSRDSSLKFI